jgi:hypothetical protein
MGAGSPEHVYKSFAQAVIEPFQILAEDKSCSYREYLIIPKDSATRRGDEANAVDQQFTRSVLAWLGFKPVDWTYNQPRSDTGKKAGRPDYQVRGSIAIAFIVEDKNSSQEFDADEHLQQMERYCLGTAGYAVWCNMRRLLAIRFVPDTPLAYETLVDVSVEGLCGPQPMLPAEMSIQKANLALFQLLFSKHRFTQFRTLAAKIALSEQEFASTAISLETRHAITSFIDGSRQTLNHLKLAALARIREAHAYDRRMQEQERILKQEWEEAAQELKRKVNYEVITTPLLAALAPLTPRLGQVSSSEIYQVRDTLEKILNETTGKSRTPTLLPIVENWLERALSINSALLSRHFVATEPARIIRAYAVWSEKQSDQKDRKPEVFAEQVAYVFFVRLLLVRVLEDKHIVRPRLASNGGFAEWSRYVARHFTELDGVGILNEHLYGLLSRKASHFYLHFFQQAVFDWFRPDDFFLVESLEFLCRYNFQHITSDIIGFTYEAYIDRNARDRKGHFLTGHEIVEYMLDLAEYTGPQIIGRRLLDPACGSGSFLVHAARRYRQALVTFFCTTYHLPETEASLQADPALRKAFATRYIQALTTCFFGLELNPFACYLAEMNLLIQALDDLFVLQQAGEAQPIERFHIYPTDSLDMPREIADHAGLDNNIRNITVPDHLSSRLADEAYPIKAKLDAYREGFFYVVSNPPYVSSKQEEIDTRRLRSSAFYQTVLCGDTNLYLLFLRLGLYYLAEYGKMIYIVPLTVFGDRSASAARKLLTTPPFSLAAAVRFYRGDVLFPGVDQAVAILLVNRRQPDDTIVISGGRSVQEARATRRVASGEQVVNAVPQDPLWQGSWLVAPSQGCFEVWQHVRAASGAVSRNLGSLLDETFERKQGDLNATHLNPFRLGAAHGSFSAGSIAIYKGEAIAPFAPVPATPSDWARPGEHPGRDAQRVAHILSQLKQVPERECGIVMREVARLNTRDRLTATWFERTSERPMAFTHELWRMKVKKDASEESGKALLALISSNVLAFLLNLFATNNHISKDDLGRIPIPAKSLPVEHLASLTEQILEVRARIENDVLRYRVRIPGSARGIISVPPATFTTSTSLPTVSIAGLIEQGEIRNTGSATGRVKALQAANALVCAIDPSRPASQAFAEILALFFTDPEQEQTPWSQAQHWQLPEPIAASDWLDTYRALTREIQLRWESYLSLQTAIDEVVADWYDLDASHRATLRHGLPWAMREREHPPVADYQAVDTAGRNLASWPD